MLGNIWGRHQSFIKFGGFFALLTSVCHSQSVKPANSKSTIDNSDIEYLALGEWRLGDSKKTILSLPSLPNLRSVKITGGFETADAIFNGEKTNISFAFDEQGLLYAQVWLYEGKNIESAVNEFANLNDFFSRNLKGATLKGVESVNGIGSDAIKDLVNEIFDRVNGVTEARTAESEEQVTFMMTLDLIPNAQPIQNKLHGQFIYSGPHDTFYVFLFEDRPGYYDRSSPTHVQIIIR